MAAVSSIVLADAQATPVNHTFLPLGPDTKGVWWFEDQSGASPIGFNRISFSIVKPTMGNAGQSSNERAFKVRIGLWTPKLETVANNSAGLVPAPTVSYVPKAFTEYWIPERATLQDRKDLRKFIVGLNGATPVVDAVESLIGVY